VETIGSKRSYALPLTWCMPNNDDDDDCIALYCVVLVELYNSQVMLRGCETKGYVIASAAKTSLLSCDHRPVWIQQQLQSKSTLVGSVECMQVISVFMYKVKQL